MQDLKLANPIGSFTAEKIGFIKAEAEQAAKDAAALFLKKWNEDTGGNQYGEPMYCGFAWVDIFGVKGNTKLGKAFKAAGIEKAYNGAYQMYNPAKHGGQSMDVKEVGAQAAADVWRSYGFTAYMGSRAD